MKNAGLLKDKALNLMFRNSIDKKKLFMVDKYIILSSCVFIPSWNILWTLPSNWMNEWMNEWINESGYILEAKSILLFLINCFITLNVIFNFSCCLADGWVSGSRTCYSVFLTSFVVPNPWSFSGCRTRVYSSHINSCHDTILFQVIRYIFCCIIWIIKSKSIISNVTLWY